MKKPFRRTEASKTRLSCCRHCCCKKTGSSSLCRQTFSTLVLLKNLLLLLFFLSGGVCAGQNLVPNGSFEDTVSCPTAPAEMYKCVGWASYGGSPDYMNPCSPQPSAV